MELTPTAAGHAPVAAATATGPGPAASPSAPAYGQTGRPYAVAHRGGSGLATENTVAAFGRSYALGVRYLETDVRVTADGVCVAFHDATLRRMTGVNGRVDETNWATLRRLRVPGDEAVLRLEDLLDAFPDARFMMDIKDPRGIGALAKALRRARAEARVCVAGSADRWLADVRAAMGGRITTAMGWESLTRLAAAARLGVRPRGVVRAPFAHVPLRLGRVPVFADRLVAMAHDLGAQVMVWTVNDPDRMHRLLDLGVDGIISDRPDLLREVFVARACWTAPGPA